ncbi:hypothetical protein OAE09_03990 [Alphaproteobacteria bacterium]|nr:hypothetical protein [Alphaproteobacteria bacterium]
MEHLLEIWLFNENAHLKGMAFGLVHSSIMLLGYYSGWSINRFFKIISNGYIAGIIGAALSHIIADILASLIDPHLRSAVYGIALGGMIPLLTIPILERWIIKSKHHIVVGDHEDIEKDIKLKHK